MMQEHVLKIYKTQLYNFDFLCKTIRNYSVDELALAFFYMQVFKEKYDEYLFDKEKVYYLNSTAEQQLNYIKQEQVIPVGNAYMNNNTPSKRYSLWNGVLEIKENLDEYIWVYNLFNDDLSKNTFLRILLARFLWDCDYLYPVYRPIAYFDTETFDIPKKNQQMIYVDCGAYDGDSIHDFIKYNGNDYKKIYAYEPTPDSFSRLVKSTKKYKNIVLRNCGVGNKKETLSFSDKPEEVMSNHVITGGEINNSAIQVQVVRLDDDINEPVSFIKMDIEGFELEALKGAENHIIYDKPQLAICVYHEMDDLRSIPKLIYSYNKNQNFFLRNHGSSADLLTEFVFYANPK